MHRVDAVVRQLHARPCHHQPALHHSAHVSPTNSTAVASPAPPPTATTSTLPPDTTDSHLALTAERATSTFPTSDLTHFLDGSAEVTDLKAMVAATIAADPVLNPPNIHVLSRHQQRTASMLKIKQCAEMVREQVASQPHPSAATAPSASSTSGDSGKREGGGDRAGVGKAFEDAFYGLMSLLDPSWSIRMGVHYGLFASSVNSQGSNEQRQRYQRQIAEMRVIGCFAMTEMGHGSNVSAIETTATYDTHRGCFILHSPTLTSTKWWIGGAAHMATHAAVYAQLVHNKKKRGVYCFVIRIRDGTSGRVVPGVTIGDMGDKVTLTLRCTHSPTHPFYYPTTICSAERLSLSLTLFSVSIFSCSAPLAHFMLRRWGDRGWTTAGYDLTALWSTVSV